MRQAANPTITAADLEVAWTRLLSIVDEAATALVRTAYSITIREMKDLAVVLFDAAGNSLAEAQLASPSFIGTLPRTMAAFLDWRPCTSWRVGDMAITNDPWLGTGHLQDISMVSPIFHRGTLVAFIAVAAHGPDIGGSLYSATSRELFEEGLRIPPCLYAESGERSVLVRDFIAANVRVPDKVIGDLEAMASACAVSCQRLSQLLDEIGAGLFSVIGNEILSRSEMAMRAAIRQVPDGIYRASVSTDGFEQPLLIEIAVKIDGDRADVDYTGTSSQQPRGINVPLTYAYAHTAYPLKCLFHPGLPNNAGAFRPVRVTAPEGCMLNPRHPAAVNARHVVGHHLSGAVFRALHQAIPDRVIAENGTPPVQLLFAGVDGNGRPFAENIVLAGGYAAGAVRSGTPVLSFPTNISWIPIEILESQTPLRVARKSIRLGSGGAGRNFGGDGQCFEIVNGSRSVVRLSVIADMTRRGAFGLAGGEAGLPCRVLIDGEPIAGKVVLDFQPGSRLLVETPGGGGYGLRADRQDSQEHRT
jgi:N-methylhydantoinase B